MSTDYILSIAIALLIFLVCIFLVIFAPKSHNFFKKIEPKLDELAQDRNLFKELLVRLGIKLNDDNIAEEYEEYYKKITPAELTWEEWPEKIVTSGSVDYLPLFIKPLFYNENYSIFNGLFGKLIRLDINIQSVFFLKMNNNSALKKHKGWANLTNNTLRFVYCFNSFCFDEDECGIWINGESKKFFKDYYYIFDASKEHSIYNNTCDEVLFLIIDFDRPEGVARGYSDNDFKYQ
jgi:hypothetical protein